jgi:hypothetical protein
MSEVAWWQGSHGDEYTERNQNEPIPGFFTINQRIHLWDKILKHIPHRPESVLEVGAGSGNNLYALSRGHSAIPLLIAVEPNKFARNLLYKLGLFDVHDGTAADPGCRADLVFTSGVLIHIPPDELLEACQGIYDAAERYIVCIEYFSADPEEKPYRGRKLWKRDFGSFCNMVCV